MGCPIRTSTDQRLLAAPRGFSQRATSFIASWCQGIHRMPLSRSKMPTMHRKKSPEHSKPFPNTSTHKFVSEHPARFMGGPNVSQYQPIPAKHPNTSGQTYKPIAHPSRRNDRTTGTSRQGAPRDAPELIHITKEQNNEAPLHQANEHPNRSHPLRLRTAG